MITSKRTFGVEMECSASNPTNSDKLRKVIGRSWHFDDDGSIRHIVPLPIEIVSPILSGRSGADELRKVCKTMKELGFNADYNACGMHVHLGAEEFKQKKGVIVLSEKEYREFMKSTKDVKDIISICYLNKSAVRSWFRLNEKLNPLTTRYRQIGTDILRPKFNEGEFYTMSADRTFYIKHVPDEFIGTVPVLALMSKEERKRTDKLFGKEIDDLYTELNKHRVTPPKKSDPHFMDWYQKEQYLKSGIENYADKRRKASMDAIGKEEGKYVLRVNDNSHTKNLANLFLFYILFDDVFLGMMPNSRREGNSYCMSLSTSFETDDVLAIKTQSDFESLWYKEKNKGNLQYHKNEHYDDSRYHNVNFHSLFNRHGTVEIRSHGATINPNKILLWTALHQSVLDAIASGLISRETLESMAHKELTLEERALIMVDLLKLPDFLRRYVIRLLNYYSDTTIVTD